MAQPQFSFNFDAAANNDGDEQQEIIIDMKELKEQAIASLPEDIQPKIKELSTLQDKYDEIATKFHEELFQLQLKYEGLYAPVLNDRSKVLTEGNGVSGFWRNVLMQSELQDVVSERDMDALQYLTNISSRTFAVAEKSNKTEEQKEPKEEEEGEDDDLIGGFTLTFTFAENPYFSNTELSQTLYYDKSGDIVEGKADGCTINWKSQDKNLTVEKKTVKKGGKKKGAAAQTITSVIPCESFFNFFGARNPEDDEQEDEDAEFHNIAGDDQLASILKEQIIPRAVDYYLGLVSLEDDLNMDMLGGDDFDDEEEEEEEEAPKKKNVKKAPAQFGGAAPASGDQQECKQQ